MPGQSQGGQADDNFEFQRENPAGNSGRTVGAYEDQFQAPGPNAGKGEATAPYQRTPDMLAPGEDPPSRQAAIKDPGEGAQSELETQFNGFRENETWLIQKSHEIYAAETFCVSSFLFCG